MRDALLSQLALFLIGHINGKHLKDTKFSLTLHNTKSLMVNIFVYIYNKKLSQARKHIKFDKFIANLVHGGAIMA